MCDVACCSAVALLCLCAVSLCWFSLVDFVRSEELANDSSLCVARVPVNKSVLLARSRAKYSEFSERKPGSCRLLVLLKCGAAGSERSKSSF